MSSQDPSRSLKCAPAIFLSCVLEWLIIRRLCLGHHCPFSLEQENTRKSNWTQSPAWSQACSRTTWPNSAHISWSTIRLHTCELDNKCLLLKGTKFGGGLLHSIMVTIAVIEWQVCMILVLNEFTTNGILNRYLQIHFSFPPGIMTITSVFCIADQNICLMERGIGYMRADFYKDSFLQDAEMSFKSL